MCYCIDFLILIMSLRRPSTPPFPYTTLFRSIRPGQAGPSTRPVASAHRDLTASRSGYAVGRPGCYSRSEEHTSELQSRENLVCRLLLEKKKKAFVVSERC